MLLQDCYNKYFTVSYCRDNIVIEINFLPKNNDYEKAKIFFDICPFFQIEKTVVKYNNKISNNENDLKMFFKMLYKILYHIIYEVFK